MGVSTKETGSKQASKQSGEREAGDLTGVSLVPRNSPLQRNDPTREVRPLGETAPGNSLELMSFSFTRAEFTADSKGIVLRCRQLMHYALREVSLRGDPNVIDAEYRIITPVQQLGMRPESRTRNPEGAQGQREGDKQKPDSGAEGGGRPESKDQTSQNAAQGSRGEQPGEAGAGSWLWGLSDLFKTASGREVLQRGGEKTRGRNDASKPVQSNGAEQREETIPASGTRETVQAGKPRRQKTVKVGESFETVEE